MKAQYTVWDLTSLLLLIGLANLVTSSADQTAAATALIHQDSSTRQETQPLPFNQRVRLAQRDFAAKKYVQAARQTKKLCDAQPTNLELLLFRGEVCFAAGQFQESVAAYDSAIQLNPSLKPRLWQRGLALYYADQFAQGVKQFEVHQTVNSQDVENAVWHLLCAAKVSDLDQARQKLIPIDGDTRIPMSQIYELFAGRMTPSEVLKVAEKTTPDVQPASPQLKLQQYYAHLYIGLYHEMLGDAESSRTSLQQAERVNPFNATNFMGQVARVHLELRKKQNQNK